jgi:cell division protein FtsZ
MAGARGLLINITGGDDLTLFEVDQAANRIREEVDEEANIIFGSAIDEALSGRIRVSVVATGIDSPAQVEHDKPRLVAVGGGAMPMPQPIPLPMQAMSLPIGAMPTPAPVMSLHPLRQAAPQVVATMGVMPETAPMMEAMTAAAPQQIPQHAVAPEPMVAAPQVRAAPAATRSTSLFAEPGPVQSAPEPSRPSLFSTVTGAFRRRQHTAAASAELPPVRAEPGLHEPRIEQPRASVRQTAGEEVGLDIPAFLRRQSS